MTCIAGSTRRLAVWAILLVVLLAASPSRAVFHLWSINEVYSNSSGSLQFIELFDNNFGSQNLINGQELRTFSLGALDTQAVTVNRDLPGNTRNHFLLFGTAGLAAAGGPVPDFIIPNGFIYTNGGTIVFFGLGSDDYPALPLDGIHSLPWFDRTHPIINSPTNYAGQTGRIPAPATLAVGAGAGWLSLRRRRTRW